MATDSSPVIAFDRVWKKFRRGEAHDSLRDLVPAIARRLAGHRPRADVTDAREFWALEDVSFTVARGEAFGIIGPNGAGKSTCLKLLTRILRPNRGRSIVRGRIGALIEVAAGFHPDLTGRENIYLQGTIMGMTREEIGRRLDAIIDFAGVEAFIDTPVKRYSSGMNARLGFSIAAHLDPDVLLVDEVLSVGDAAFQERCLARMREFRDRGVTMVFISHNLQAVAELCDRALYLHRSVRAIGPVEATIDAYLQDQIRRDRTAPGEVAIIGAELRDGDAVADAHPLVTPGAELTLRVAYEARADVAGVTFGFMVHRSTDGWTVYDAHVDGAEIGVDTLPAGSRFTVDFRFRAHLPRGQYHIGCHVRQTQTARQLCWLEPAALFGVAEYRTFKGTANLYVEPTLVNRSVVPDGMASALVSRP